MYLYLLDTNIISDLIKNPQGDLAKIVSELEPNSFCTSIIVACELSYGVKKKDSIQLAKKVEILLSTLDVLPLDNNVHEHYANLRNFLEKQGQVIGGNDMLIAAHALALNVTLITANVNEFNRVPDLRVENWLAER